MRIRAYVLTQSDLLNELEVLELSEFAVFEVSVQELQDLTGLDVFNAKPPRRPSSEIEALDTERFTRRISSVNEIIL